MNKVRNVRIYIYGNKSRHEYLRVIMNLTERVDGEDVSEDESFRSASYTENSLSREMDLSEYQASQIIDENKSRKYEKMKLYDCFKISI